MWGWDDDEQLVFFERRFRPERLQIIQVAGEDVGSLFVEDRGEELFLADIEILPAWQGRGLGSSIIRSLMERAGTVTLRVLRVNERARRLYERLGFRPYRTDEAFVYLRWEA